MYDPRDEEILKFKGRALCGEFLPDEENVEPDPDRRRIPGEALNAAYIRNTEGKTVKLSEEYEDIWYFLQETFEAQIFDLVTIFSGYFKGDPLEEIKKLREYSLPEHVGAARLVKEQRVLMTPSEIWPKERQEAYRARMTYFFAKRRIDGLKREAECSESYLKAMEKYILGK